MSGGVFYNFRKGSSGASSAHARYITRRSAVKDDEKGLYSHNLPEYLNGETYAETRANLIEYARQREEDEREKPSRGSGEQRIHYRGTISFEEKVGSEKVCEMVEEYMRENFPEGRGFAVVHQDTNHTHAHIWLDARGTDDKKLNLTNDRYKTLDERWATIYGREFGKEKELEHLAKKAETKKQKLALARSEKDKTKTNRASRSLTRSEYAEREERNYGSLKDGARGNQSSTPNRESVVAQGERAVDKLADQGDRTEQAARGALQSIERVRDLIIERAVEKGR